MSKELHDHSIAEIGNLLRRREISAPELTEHYLKRIHDHESDLGVYSIVTSDIARSQARKAQEEMEKGLDLGPLHGIPIALKDNIDTAGTSTVCNSFVLAGRVPRRDASVSTELRRAGAIQLGKATLHEFAFGGPAWDTPDKPARNPWAQGRFTGGSSSGSAAAVAGGLAMAAVGTDTVGSIRLPSALSGVVGFKPTYERVSNDGIVPLSYSLDHCGPIAGSVEDCIHAFRAMAPQKSTGVTVAAGTQVLSGLRVGYIRHFYEEDCGVTADVARIMEQSADAWRRHGAELVDVQLSSLDVYSACCMTIMLSEALAIHEADLKTRFLEFGEIVRDRLALASFFTAADYVQAQRMRRRLFLEMEEAFSSVDVLVTAAFPAEAPLLTEVDKFYILQEPLLTTPFNVTGMPTVCLPAGLSTNGLPIGLQIAANLNQDERLLQIAALFEAETEFPEARLQRGLPAQ